MGEEGITAWERRQTQLHADCRVYRILREHWQNNRESSEGDFYVMEVADWAVTIALTDEGNCVLVRQFRFGTGDFTWELPAGVVDEGEDPLEGGVRELYEESGYKGKSARVLGVVHPNPAIQRNRCHLILVEGAERIGKGDPGPHEFFDVREVPVETLFEWARNGTITHAIVHAALFYLRDYLETGAAPGAQ
ncbi:MAG: NUDIX hydrolase [Opitutales bacterium]|jgi:ADP-ribose pyrophosphatase